MARPPAASFASAPSALQVISAYFQPRCPPSITPFTRMLSAAPLDFHPQLVVILTSNIQLLLPPLRAQIAASIVSNELTDKSKGYTIRHLEMNFKTRNSQY